MVLTVPFKMLALCLAAAFCTGLAAECAGESACSRANDADDIEQTDLWLLQVHQNVSQVEESVTNRTGLGLNVTQNISRVALAQSQAFAQSEAGRSVEAAGSRHLTGLSAASIFVDLAVVILIVLLLGVLYKLSSASSEEREVSFTSKSKASGSEPFAPIPILCSHFQNARESQTDHQFRLETSQVLDDQRATFSVMNDKNVTLMTVTLSEGRMMRIKSVHADGPGVLLRGASTATDVIMTVYSENGAYFGKVARGPQGGVIFYHMQKPCAEFKTLDGPLSFSVEPLKDPGNKIANIRRSDPNMHIHVKAGYDAVLFLGCILGIVCLEPTLVKLMNRED